jgi:hypothetical protein
MRTILSNEIKNEMPNTQSLGAFNASIIGGGNYTENQFNNYTTEQLNKFSSLLEYKAKKEYKKGYKTESFKVEKYMTNNEYRAYNSINQEIGRRRASSVDEAMARRLARRKERLNK